MLWRRHWHRLQGHIIFIWSLFLIADLPEAELLDISCTSSCRSWAEWALHSSDASQTAGKLLAEDGHSCWRGIRRPTKKAHGSSPRRRAMRSPTARAPTAPNAAAMPTELPTTPVVMPAAAPPTPTPVMTVPATAASAGAAGPPACKLFSEETLVENLQT